MPSVFETWNARTFDRLFVFRSQSEGLRPEYDETIAHVDLNNTTIQALNNFYLNRSHHAQVVRNLSAMNVSAQMFDLIFAAPSTDTEDIKLIDAVKDAGNAYFGLAFELRQEGDSQSAKDIYDGNTGYLNRTKWHPLVKDNALNFYFGANPLITFPSLAAASRGLGYLSLNFDIDGVFRRTPLLVRYGDAFYPSFPFRATCDYLNVPPENILLGPGKTITLKNARRPHETIGHDIVIPVDQYGNMIINFIGPWGRMKHYNFSDALRASEDRDELEMWREEMSGKIVIVSEVTTGSSDIGPVPTDANFPLSGLHANVMHTILTESFLRELTTLEMFGIELLISLTVLGLSVRLSSVSFSLSTFGIGIGYVCTATLLFLYGSLILHLVRPLLIISFAMVFILVYRFIIEEKEKEVLRRSFEAYFPPLIVKKLMANPEMIAGLKVTGLLTDDGYKFSLEDGGWLLIRFSGTEPIIRVYTETTRQDLVEKILADGLRIAGFD